MTRSIVLSAALAALIVTPASAQTFRAENRVTVTPLAGSDFQISSGGDYGARGMWCAASDYAKDVLGVSGTTRLYITGPRTSTSGPVTFGLGSDRPVNSTFVIVGATLRQEGANLSVDHAYQFCYDARITNSR
jgi:hypothetical protein